jgi:tetratricopeptide (TPR) repeat protein
VLDALPDNRPSTQPGQLIVKLEIVDAIPPQDRFDDAAIALNSAIAINPRVASYYYVLSTIYRRQGKLDESREAMEKFSKLNRESDELEERRRESLRPERAGRE